MIPDAGLLDDVRPTDNITATGRPTPQFREELRRIPNLRNAFAVVGLYVQTVSGLHSGTSPVSGDFSVGAVGLMIRDGALAEPVREVTVASTLQRILLDVAEVGADLTWLPGSAAGATVLVSEMQVSGT